MLAIISPAKTLDFNVRHIPNATMPGFLKEASVIADKLKLYNPEGLAELLGISHKLAALNANRYTAWNKNDHHEKGKASLLVYNGDVYQGLQAGSFTDDELDFAQKHLRIISGLYGVLRPLDLILPYRLDMGTAIKVGKANDLYQYWTVKVTGSLKMALKENNQGALINLASEEYFKTIDVRKISTEVITPVFKDFKNGQYKIISFFAKKARGMMSRYIVGNRIENPQDLKLFTDEGYYFSDHLSDKKTWVFTRG